MQTFNIQLTFETGRCILRVFYFAGHISVMCFIAIPHVKSIKTGVQTYTHFLDRMYITFML